MEILPLHHELKRYLRIHSLEKKFSKQIKLLLLNHKHPSLNVELLEPKSFQTWSFRIDRKYRALFIFVAPGVIEIFDINNHYK